jgi:hypothetical protein
MFSIGDPGNSPPGNGSCCNPKVAEGRINIGQGPGFSVNYGGPPPHTNGPDSGTADLSNDHPIGVAYSNDGRASLRPKTTTLVSIALYNASSLRHDVQDEVYGRSDNYWSVYGYINADATIQDLLRGADKVECASCHDPHYKNQTNNDPSVVNSYQAGYILLSGGNPSNFSGQFDGYVDGLFLRRVGGNSNSGVCRTCHGK